MNKPVTMSLFAFIKALKTTESINCPIIKAMNHKLIWLILLHSLSPPPPTHI